MRKEVSNNSGIEGETRSTIAFCIDSNGETKMFTEFRNRTEQFALLQYLKLEEKRLERDLE